MDTTLVKSDSPEDCVCRCCSKSFHADQLHSLFEYTNEETEIYKILMILAPISICRNDGELGSRSLFSIVNFLNSSHFRIFREVVHRLPRASTKCLSVSPHVHQYRRDSSLQPKTFDGEQRARLLDMEHKRLQRYGPQRVPHDRS